MSNSTSGAPPIDVTKPEIDSRSRLKKVEPIRDEDLVFQDVNDPAPKVDSNLATVRADIIGRGLPHRDGKGLVRFIAFDKVKVLKTSRDGRWIAVQAMRSGKKGWVPKAAVLLPVAAPQEEAVAKPPNRGSD